MAGKRKSIPQSVRFNVLRRDNFTCRYCGRGSPAVVLHLDHVKPYSAGGADTEANLITSCDRCNYGKGVKTEVLPPTITPAHDASGFVGLFGHTYTDELAPEVRYQFRVLRQVSPDRYAVQLFSWLDGSPTEIQVWSADDLSAPSIKFYLDHKDWVSAGDESSEAQASRRGQRPPLRFQPGHH